jgi:signal transduction histidine kinase
MTPGAVGTITIGPEADPASMWTAILSTASSCGLGWLPAVRLTVAAIALVGDAHEQAVVELTVVDGADGARVEATVRGGTGCPERLPAGLADHRPDRVPAGGGQGYVVAVAVDPRPRPESEPLRAAAAAGFDPLRLLGAALVVVDRLDRRLAECDAETDEFRAELDETNRGLLALYAELEAANRRIADLVAMLSHDIRQPLAVITSFTSLLLEEWDLLDDVARRRDLTRISTAGVGMTSLVEEILTLTQIDTEGFGIRPAPIQLSSAVADAVAVISGTTPDAVTVYEGGDHWVFADPRHLHQILTNLISNAFKYGCPPVEITVVAVGDAVEISVRDHGDGVPPDFLPRLFERFARADTPMSRAKKGTGLGLYIVRQLTEANGGAIEYRDHSTGGACFTVRLPAAGPHPTP